MQQLIAGWLEGWQAAERGRFVPWLPVFMGTGVLAYFALRSEPPPWLGVAVAIPAICGALLLRRSLLPGTAIMALAAAAIGFTSSQFATIRAPPPAPLPTHATILTGTVRSVEALPEGRRIALESVELDGGNPLQRWLRVRLRRGDDQEIAAGDTVRLRALVRPPMSPAYPGAWDLQRDAWYSGQGGLVMPLARWSASPKRRRMVRCGWCSACGRSLHGTSPRWCPARPARCRSRC